MKYLLKKIMDKAIFENNMAEIKIAVANITNANDNLRVIASVNTIVDRAFISPRDMRDKNKKMRKHFVEYACEWYDLLTSKYHVYTRDALIEAILNDLGMSDLNAICFSSGKREIEDTLCEMIFNK